MIKTITLSMCLCLAASSLSLNASAQDQRGYTYGPVTEVDYIAVEYGHFEEYMAWVTSTWVPTMEAAKKAGYQVKVGKFPFTASGKAKAAGAPEGFVKVMFDAKYGEWLGAHFIGSNVTEMIAEVVAARRLETTGHEIIKSVHPHPTMSEAIMEATAAAYGEVIHL